MKAPLLHRAKETVLKILTYAAVRLVCEDQASCGGVLLQGGVKEGSLTLPDDSVLEMCFMRLHAC